MKSNVAGYNLITERFSGNSSYVASSRFFSTMEAAKESAQKQFEINSPSSSHKELRWNPRADGIYSNDANWAMFYINPIIFEDKLKVRDIIKV